MAPVDCRTKAVWAITHCRRPWTTGLRALRPVLATAVIFGLFINLLLFVSPLYMLQIYDRVIPSRSETTLIGITLIAAFGLAVYATLDMLRSRLLVRGGVIFDGRSPIRSSMPPTAAC